MRQLILQIIPFEDRTVSIYQDFWKFGILTWGWLLRLEDEPWFWSCVPYELISKSWVIWCKCVEMHCNLSDLNFFQVAFQNYFRFLDKRKLWNLHLANILRKNCWKLTVIVCWHVISVYGDLWWLLGNRHFWMLYYVWPVQKRRDWLGSVQNRWEWWMWDIGLNFFGELLDA